MTLIINELYPSPASSETEWLEIYNAGAGAVSLKGWQIAESVNGVIKNHELINKATEATLSAHGYWLVEPTKVSLNNSGDTIYLFRPDGTQADVVTYPSLTKKSYARASDGGSTWVTTEPTRGLTNQETTTSTATSDNTDTSEGTDVQQVVASNHQTAQSSSAQVKSDSNNSSVAAVSAATDDWRDHLSFRRPRTDYHAAGQVLGASVQATAEAALPASDRLSLLSMAPPSLPLALFFLPIFVIILGIGLLGAIIYDWWQEKQNSLLSSPPPVDGSNLPSF